MFIPPTQICILYKRPFICNNTSVAPHPRLSSPWIRLELLSKKLDSAFKSLISVNLNVRAQGPDHTFTFCLILLKKDILPLKID